MQKKEVCWNITTKCNQNCKYCHRFLGINDLCYEENERILDNLIKDGITDITWTGGEALLYPNLISLLKKAKENGINNKLITNGMLLAQNDEIKEICNYLDSLTLSIDSTDNEINAENAILHHKEGVDLIPANLDLSAIEFSLVNAMSREFTLKNSIRGIKDNYDYVLIDCMPSLGMITINALACSDKIIIPVQGEYLAAKGMGHLLKTVTRVQKQINPNLKIGGV